MTRSLIAGVGHWFWRDLSAGPVWSDRLAAGPWPENVFVEDYSFGAIAMVQQLEAESFERAIFITAEARGRPPATLYLERHRARRQSPERVQEYMTEAGAGVVAIDPLMAIGQHFDALPAETWVLEVEPKDTGWGDGLSPEVESLYPQALELLRSFAEEEAWQPLEMTYDT